MYVYGNVAKRIIITSQTAAAWLSLEILLQCLSVTPTTFGQNRTVITTQQKYQFTRLPNRIGELKKKKKMTIDTEFLNNNFFEFFRIDITEQVTYKYYIDVCGLNEIEYKKCTRRVQENRRGFIFCAFALRTRKNNKRRIIFHVDSLNIYTYRNCVYTRRQ